MLELKVIGIGASAGIVLPEAALARLGVAMGDTLYLVEAPGGAWRLMAAGPDVARQLALAEALMREDRDVLGSLEG